MLAPDVLPQGRRLRLRIVATDGFRTASATSRPFAAPGARPRVTITSPGTGGVYARGARIELVGRAVLRAGGVVPGRRLRWLDGRRQLGRGARLATTRLARGRHVLTLVATAGPGLVGRARVTIRVR